MSTKKHVSGTDAAVMVINRRHGKPTDVKTLAERAVKLGWKAKGATPHQTMSAMVQRDERFVRNAPGLWTLAK
jgi:hypothetical protein